MLLEGLSNTVLRWLRIPPGTSLRHSNEVSTNGAVDILNNPYIDTIVGITVDDVCIGENPLSIDFADTTPEEIQTKLKEICDEFNTIVKDVAWDLCTLGYSVYRAKISDKNKLVVLPYIEAVSFYLTAEKKIVVCDEDKKPIDDAIVFLNFNRRGLMKIEGDDHLAKLYAFGINPEAMQLKNVESTLASLMACETNLDRYRAMVSRVVRLVNVDVGTTQGDQQKDVVDTISSAINANSGGLTNVVGINEFDDNIPVIPTRGNLGRAELSESVPNYNLKDLGDMEHYMNKLNLVTRFPGSYMDFSKGLGETTASLLRSDIRYYKLCNKVRSKIVDVLNEFVKVSEKFRKYEPAFVLTQLPTSEDEDVISSLENYIGLAQSAEEFVMGQEAIPKNLRIHRLQLLQDLFASSTTSPMLQKWFEDFREFIDSYDDIQESGLGMEGGPSGDDFGGSDFGGGPDIGGEDLGGEDFEETPSVGGESQPMDFVNESGGSPDVEFLNEPLTQ